MKLVFGRNTFLSRFCVFASHHNGSGVSPAEETAGYTELSTVTRNVSRLRLG